MNVMLTCAGRRNYLILDFRRALGGRGRVLAGDMTHHASALHEADEKLILPPIDRPEYVDVLLDTCKKKAIGLLVPLNDYELPILAARRGDFLAEGTIPLVASPTVVDQCLDKLKTNTLAEGLGLRIPETFTDLGAAMDALDSGSVDFPLFVKPRWGSSSVGLESVGDRHELELAWRLAQLRVETVGLRGQLNAEQGVLIQQGLSGAEYGLDVVNDLEGAYQTSFVKRKIGMRAGETDRAEVVHDSGLEDFGRKIAEALGHPGIVDCDVFLHDDEPALLEINPRFGGGYPFSAAAGADLPSALIAWCQGIEAPQGWDRVEFGVTGSKCDRVVRVGPDSHTANMRTGAIGSSLIPMDREG